MPSPLTVHCVTVNARDPWALAAFWAGLVGGTPRSTGNGYVLVDPGPGGVRLLFQPADDEPRDRGWIHLDCATTGAADREAAVSAVVAAGGRLVERRSDSNGAWVVLADPEGNLFCV